jgi:hypothetical protein
VNERIKELAKQAGLQPFEDCGPGYVYKMEKFAELIVQECMWKIMVRKDEAIDNHWNVDEAMSAALMDISEHFGVEE